MAVMYSFSLSALTHLQLEMYSIQEISVQKTCTQKFSGHKKDKQVMDGRSK